MSTEQNAPNNENTSNRQTNEDYVVTDSVHEMFRQLFVHCDDCDCDIVGNEAAIKKHFNNTHPSNRHCRYCRGKVFIYRKITKVDCNEISQEFIYHKCEHEEQVDMNVL